MNKKVAILIHRFYDKEFQSGNDKADYYIIKAIKNLGYEIDIYCNEKNISIDSEKLYKNLYVQDHDAYQKNKDKYLFSFSDNSWGGTTFSYVHENTRFYREKYTKNHFEKVIEKIFAYKRYKHLQNFLKQQIKMAQEIETLLVPSSFVKEDVIEAYGKTENDICILPLPAENTDTINYKKNEHKTFTFGLSGRGFANKGGYEFIFALIVLNLLGINCNGLIIYPFSKTAKNLGLLLKVLGLGKKIQIIDYCSDMNDFYKKIDCLVMASKREAFGLVALEAIARDIPVIINTRCGIKDFIKNKETGFVYDYNNPIINLIKTMKYVVQNKEVLSDIINRAREITKTLSFDNFKENLKKILDNKGYLNE